MASVITKSYRTQITLCACHKSLYVFCAVLSGASLIAACSAEINPKIGLVTNSSEKFNLAVLEALKSDHLNSEAALSRVLGMKLEERSSFYRSNIRYTTFAITNFDDEHGKDFFVIAALNQTWRSMYPQTWSVDIEIKNLSLLVCLPLQAVVDDKHLNWQKVVGLGSGFVAEKRASGTFTSVSIDRAERSDCVGRVSLYQFK